MRRTTRYTGILVGVIVAGIIFTALSELMRQHPNAANAASSPQGSAKMKRYGSVIKVRPEKLDEYKRLHAQVWPDVLSMIQKCNIRNYSIYLKDGYLFSYFEYIGSDYDADMAKMAADPTTQKWWAVCKPCQEPLATRAEGEWWANMEEVFHTD